MQAPPLVVAGSPPGFRVVLGFAYGQWRRQRSLAFACIVLLLAATGIEITVPLLTGRLIDQLVAPLGNSARIVGTFIGLVFLAVFFQLFQKLGAYLVCCFTLRVMRRVGADAFAYVQRLPTDWHASNLAGAAVRDITRAMWAFDALTGSLLHNVMPSIVVLLGVVALLAAKWPLLAVALFLGAIGYIALSSGLVAVYVAPVRRAAVSADSTVVGVLSDALTCNALVKSTGAEDREDARLSNALASWQERMCTAWFASLHIAVAQMGYLLVLHFSVLGGMLWLWQAGQATPGDVAYLLASLTLVQHYLRDIGSNLRNLQQSANDLEPIVAHSRTPLCIVDRAGASDLTVPKGLIRFERLQFRYSPKSERVIDDLSLEVRPGERIALVGRSGSGKTTLVRLLQRIYEPEEGRVLIDGQDVGAVTQGSLRRAIALVPQEPVLFHRSLAENISYAKPEATDAEIEAAARQVNLDELVARLPDGYATLVGERGIKLSGGERQRVAIARAILADCPILILDEPTSSLDMLSECLVGEALKVAMRGRTVLIISHRLATVRDFDRILVLERGRIVEEGEHDELLAIRDGYYRQLHAKQFPQTPGGRCSLMVGQAPR